jgi:mono/diheme cytochrome c family protein
MALALVLGFGAAPAAAAPPTPSFARDVAPVLNRWCVACHGPEEAEADLRLDSYEGALKGGDDGPVIAPGDPTNSQLLAQIERRVRPPMPPKKRLPRDPVVTIRTWIASGARP